MKENNKSENGLSLSKLDNQLISGQVRKWVEKNGRKSWDFRSLIVEESKGFVQVRENEYRVAVWLFSSDYIGITNLASRYGFLAKD